VNIFYILETLTLSLGRETSIANLERSRCLVVVVRDVRDCFWRTVDGRLQARIPTRSGSNFFENRSTIVFVTLEAIIEAPVRVVVRLSQLQQTWD